MQNLEVVLESMMLQSIIFSKAITCKKRRDQMDIHTILANYDTMFGKYALADIEAYLYENINKAREQSETGVLFTL